MPSVFAVPVFFVCMRECIETGIVVSTLLAFLKQTLPSRDEDAVRKKLARQVWYGVGVGLLVVIIVGAGMIGAFYGLGRNVFSHTEDLWDGIFGLIASLIITVMGAALLRLSKMQEKWRVRIAQAVQSRETTRNLGRASRFKIWCERYAMFTLPFVTVLREGLEGVVFIGGVGIGQPASAFPLAVVSGLLAGALVGFFIYKGGNRASLQIFLVISTWFLYLVAAGLFSRAVWYFQNREWGLMVGRDASEVGSGPGSYNIRESVWHVNCCNPKVHGGGGWGVFNSLFGWTNSATYGSVISYNVYWTVVILTFLVLQYRDVRGHWPFIKRGNNSSLSSPVDTQDAMADSDSAGHSDSEKHPRERVVAV